MAPIPTSLPESPPAGLVAAPRAPGLRETAEALAEAGGTPVAAILLYGSHVQDSAPDRWSAYDFILVTDACFPFFQNLVEGGHHDRPVWLLTVLSHVLPPNIVSFDAGRPDQAPAKCSVLTTRQLRRSLGRHSPDHFIKGRVVQKVALVWVRSPDDEAMVLSALRAAREGIVRWVRPFLRGDFTLEGFAETMLQVSYRGEIRPESPDRVDQVFRSQKETLVGIAAESLEAAVERGEAVRIGPLYRWTPRPGPVIWAWYKAYFALSKARGVARWFKYVITFKGWTDYIQRKIERRAGFRVELEEREKRWPVIFIWPKLFRVLRRVRAGASSIETEAEGSGLEADPDGSGLGDPSG